MSALLRWPFACVGELLTALVKPSEAEARMLSRMYPDMDALNEIEGAIECHEPDAPYLKWGTKAPDYSIEVKDGSPYRIGKDFHLGPRYTYCNGCGSGYTGEHNCLRDLPPTPEGGNPGEVEPSPSAPSPGVNPSGAIPPGAVPGEGPAVARGIPQPPTAGQPTSQYMAESDAVVAQFNESEDRRLRLALDVESAVTENTEFIDGATDWIEVAYALQRDYVITPRPPK